MNRSLYCVALLAALMCLPPSPADACGGFFCRQQQMDQSGERVLFAVSGGTVKAHIQIMYQGEADRFAWVLPLPSQPSDIGVGTDTLFQRLNSVTRPRFQVYWLNNNGCYYYGGFGGDMEMAGNAAPTAEDDGGKGVEVLDSGSVGPFDYHVIKGTSNDSGDEVFQWLADNDYDQPETAKDLVVTYVAENHVFVAVKLQSDAETGDIQPLTMQFPFPGSCVPLRLTSIAATENMPIWVYMLGQHRAVPVNYFHVEINEKKINWLRNGNNYAEIARDAVDTAAGRGFLTEFAGDTNDMKGQLWKPGQYDTTSLLEITEPWVLIQTLLQQNYPRTAMMQNLFRKHIPMPESLKDKNVSEQQFYNGMQNYKDELADFKLDIKAFVEDLEAKVLKPLEEANHLFNEHRYMTRLYTIISPSEMTRDPIFLFNPDLPNVSNVHRATGKAYCKKDGKKNEIEKVVVTLQNGDKLTYDGPFNSGNPPELDEATAGTIGGPAKAVQRMYTSGEPEKVAKEDVTKVDEEFDTITIGLVASGALGGTPSGARPNAERTDSGGSSGCSVSSGGPVLGFLLAGAVALLGLIGLRRREA